MTSTLSIMIGLENLLGIFYSLLFHTKLGINYKA